MEVQMILKFSFSWLVSGQGELNPVVLLVPGPC